ncbi:MAG: DEAD/DEAH box helicase, partial [Candidatus Riflebacteria bacterium]|nr:DEAD/DEAH box helicase [Candidatus Riflebacteria bacterium]
MLDTQVERRQQKALEEGFKVKNIGDEPVFSTFSVLSPSKRTYQVTIRSLKERINSCSCPDFRTNLLGTCKHIEAVLALALKRHRKRIDELERHRPPVADIFLRYGEQVQVALTRPRSPLPAEVQRLTERHFDSEGLLLGDPTVQLPVLLDEVAHLSPKATSSIRLGPDVQTHGLLLIDGVNHRRQKEWFLTEVREGKRSLEVLGAKLYPYQVEGLLHLAFSGRALLADDMGLGKTVQAIAATALLKEIRGISRVLVVTPASLKHQWLREIHRFTSLSAEVVGGPSSKRELLYAQPAFFTVINYELLLRDQQVFERLAPDLVILDEAQRVKNWRTKTAQAVKQLRSRYMFVLTGTPLENNLDELYSVMQTLDPRLLGPLWQFNTRYYQLERRRSGSYRVLGYKNLEELRGRIRPVVLRRERHEVLKDLPPRVDNNYFVPMTPAQLDPYRDFQGVVAQLINIAERRPLTPQESKRLMMALQKMRILCDALELHDHKIPDKLKKQTAPKLDELKTIIEEQVVETGRKAILFSSFEGMIDLAIERVARPLGIAHVKLAGSVPTAKRGQLLDRFRDDPTCLLFFSTDAGGVGLNLQAASLVVNLDLPWNPAVLEQRIGRAHRMGQKSTVSVINLVSQGTIEEKMLDTLDVKRQIFQAVFAAIDGQDELVFAKNRGLMARLRQMLTEEPPAPTAPRELRPGEEPVPVGAPPVESRPVSPDEQVQVLADRLSARLGSRLLLVQRMASPPSGPVATRDLPRVLVVVDREADVLASIVDEVTASVVSDTIRFATVLFDRLGYQNLATLLGGSMAAPGAPDAYRSPALPLPEGERKDQQSLIVDEARGLLTRAEERVRLA